MAANFRNIYGLLVRVNTNDRRNVTALWPLSIDEKKKRTLTPEEMFERNKKILGNGSDSESTC